MNALAFSVWFRLQVKRWVSQYYLTIGGAVSSDRRVLLIASLAVVAIFVGAGCGGTGSKSASKGGDDTRSSSTGSISGSTEDWLQALCQPGKFMDGMRSDGPFSGSIGGGTCIGPVSGRGPVYLTQWDSNYKMRNAMAMMHMCYASAIESSGTIDTFSVIGQNTAALQPLSQFGFSTSC
ncbi:MAG: hypothetical protein K1X67_20415 [Fimbriimonadaceae bacterium]|nr:hypothetical protein [Fimbriimonadaceae bacterium]